MIEIVELNHRARVVATAIHHLQIVAYRQEAALIGATDFPPLRVTIDDLLASNETFCGALLDGQLCGVIGFEEEGTSTQISSLVIAPDMQRRGTGIALVRHVLGRCKGKDVRVTTAALNVPAIALYRCIGFVESGRMLVSENIELITLERARGM